ncbi:unnamed protein product, partial [Rotaria socialis]
MFRMMKCKKQIIVEKIIIGVSHRSYNDQLFPQAVEVLQRINYPPERIAEFQKLHERVK